MTIKEKEDVIMDLPQKFLDDLKQADDVYTLISVCYNVLLNYKDDTDMVFITRAGHLSQDMEYNKSAGAFEGLRQNLLIHLNRIDMGLEEDGMGFECFHNYFLRELASFSCPSSMDMDTCISLCMFYTLEALDSYVNKNLDSVYKNYKDYGPLNGGDSIKHSVVYLKERTSLLSRAYAVDDEFRKPLRETRIGSVFQAVLLMRCQEFYAAVPKIAPILMPDAFTNEPFEKLCIVSIPYIGFDTFKFHESNSKEPCNNPKGIQGPFYVEYDDADELDSHRTIALLDLAIQKGANIIVFPEYIMSDNMLESITEHLKGLDYANKKQLLLVLAGTTYQHDATVGGNNILHILNASGFEVGCYYKYSPFLVQSEESFHGATITAKGKKKSSDDPDSPSKRQFINTCEILSDPGKECTLVDIELVGRIQPAICRDVTDGKYTERLAELFLPSFLMVPAWSPSVSSFNSRFSILADTIHTASLLCNCCNAVEGKTEKVIGKLKYPWKQGTTMQAQGLDICRKPFCMDNCKDNGGCIIKIDIDFSRGKPLAIYNSILSSSNA